MSLRKSQLGAAIIEAIICLPLILLLVAGIIDAGSIMFQVILASDATRYGARRAALFAGGSVIVGQCDDLRTVADTATTDYMTNTLKIPQQQWEIAGGTASICSLQKAGMARPFVILTEKVQIKQSILKTCLFCSFSPFTRTSPTASSTYIIAGGCCAELDPDGGCVSPDPCP